MKKVFSILMVALLATAIVSCQKDDEANPAGGETQSTIADNTLVYDGTTYVFDHVVVDYYHSELTLLSASTEDTLESGSPRLSVEGIHIMPECWNNSFDLASASQYPDGVMVGMHMSGVVEMSFEQYNNGSNTGGYGTLDGQTYENESIFSSGTYTVSGNNDGTPITVTYDGVLKNGKTLKLKIVSGSYNV